MSKYCQSNVLATSINHNVLISVENAQVRIEITLLYLTLNTAANKRFFLVLFSYVIARVKFAANFEERKTIRLISLE